MRKFELVLATGLFLLLLTAFAYTIDPLEKAEARSDERLAGDAAELLSAISEFDTVMGRFPWSDDLGSETSHPALPWTKASDKAASQELEKTQDLRLGDLLVASGPQAGPVYVCFLPRSEKFREKISELKRISPEGGILSGKPEACPQEVTWTGSDVCYFCISSF